MQGVTTARLPGDASRTLVLKRVCAAIIAGLAWFALAVQLYFNIEEALIKDTAVSGNLVRYFSFFTIQTNILIALALTSSFAWPYAEFFLTKSSVISGFVVYIIVVGGVYAAMLRHLWHPQGLQYFADVILHNVIPLVYPLYWLVFLPKGQLRWIDPLRWLYFPMIFFVYSMGRGAAFGAYPYPFIDAAKLGASRVIGNAFVLLAIFCILGVVLTAIDRALGGGNRGRSRLGRIAEL